MTETRDVCVVGAGPAGLTASIFTARADLDTLVVNVDESILRRNAHLENVPGFPAGVNSRRFLEMTREQAERNGAAVRKGTVTQVARTSDDRLEVGCEGAPDVVADYVVCCSWADTGYLAELQGVGLTKRGSKTYVDVADDGSTGVDGLYAAGRLAETHHQTVVAAGDAASVALTVVDDSDVPFYHDWVAPEGYFTGRGREVPPGCEEIDDEERRRREAEAREVMQAHFGDPHPDEPTQHPSVAEDE
ncbi:FAD-binding protein [Halobacteriales archaeon Cl-PHB]